MSVKGRVKCPHGHLPCSHEQMSMGALDERSEPINAKRLWVSARETLIWVSARETLNAKPTRKAKPFESAS